MGQRTQRLGVVRAVVALSTAAVVCFVAGVFAAPLLRSEPGPDNSLPPRIGNEVGASTSLAGAVKQLEAEGIIVRRNVRDSLGALLYWYDRRPDLQTALGAGPGKPDIVRLLAWAAPMDDATGVTLIPYRPGLNELRGRMGIIDENSGSDFVNALFWLLANRAKPQVDTDPVIPRLAAVWRQRPEIHQQFIANGRLQLAPLVFWAATLPKEDPSYPDVEAITFHLEQLQAELSKR